jgi:hypothetical protein
MPHMKLKFVTGGALAALAAVLALAAVPAEARDSQQRHNRGEVASETVRAERGSNHARPQRTAPQLRSEARPQRVAPQARENRNWTPPARTEQRRPGTWAPQLRQQQEQRSEAPRTQTRTQRWNETAPRTERNRDYASRDRNTSYRSNDWRDGRRDTDRNWRDGRRDTDRDWRDGRRDGDRNWRDNNRNHQRWDRNWHNNNRYDWQRYRSSNRHVFHIGRYYAPYRNYSYRRLGIGFSLNSLFYSNRYWINNPWQYRLPEAYGPYRWVRYYDDALLVDIYSGQVVDVIYDFFW